MAVKSTNKASSSKRTTASFTAKTSTTGPKPASPRTRAQKVQEAAPVVPVVQVDENFDPSTAMEVTPRYVKVPFGRMSRLNYQQARASAVRKHGLPQPSTTPAPTAMNRPPLTMFDAPTKVVLPSVALVVFLHFDVMFVLILHGRRVSRTPTQPNVDATVATPDNHGGETDSGEETDAAAPPTSTNGQPSGDATDTEDVTESRDDGDADTPSFLSVAVEVDGDATDVEGETAPSTPTPVSRIVQHETTIDDATFSTPLQPLVDGESQPSDAGSSHNIPFVVSEPQGFGGMHDQNPVADMWNNLRTEAIPSTVDPCPTSHYISVQEWNIPTVDTHQQSPSFSNAYRLHNTTRPLARTGTDFDLAARLNQLNVQATYLPNGFEGYAQVHPDTVANPIVHFQGLSASAPASAFHYERPDALPPFSSIWPQSLGSYCSEPAQFQHAGIPAPQTYQFYPQAPLATHLHQSAPASCPPARRDRAHPPTIRTTIHSDPQLEWQAKVEEISERKHSDLAQDQNPFQKMKVGKRGLLYITKPGEDEPRKYIPLPARAQAKRFLRPVKGSEEDLIERIERDRQIEVKAARRLEKKAAKQMEIEAKESHPTEKKAEKLARKSAKRDKRSSDEETSGSARSGCPAKKQKTSK